jgi:hypothetical protein
MWKFKHLLPFFASAFIFSAFPFIEIEQELDYNLRPNTKELNLPVRALM